MPALLIMMFNVLLCSRKLAAHARTLLSEVWSISKRCTCGDSVTSPRAARALVTFRAVRKRVAPIASIARAVSIPKPAEHPVISTTLSLSFPSSSSSLTTCNAVGR
ncbi:hypothetical protein BOTNAR_0172g00170 [Botryotinia narcissicola]|uniref:Secreted protein n=1 Tax=Botryotinia narcissicola TaxID=278944 RepID=A0A4Z1IH65_9HELO|nr:hypothetical protein BOTNAR_0172g00170 [Botryotinia narcissicola]